MIYVGMIELDGIVDITDPCYDKDALSRMTTECKPGKYYGYIERDGWNESVKQISIYRNDIWVDIDDMELIGDIGVDAGLAGFFNNKKDFNDDEWQEFCDKLSDEDEYKDFWNMYDGVFSDSGYGDGSYYVYANVDRSAFTIVFIDENEDDDYDNYDEDDEYDY